jgi:16S rRNA (cytidine1402-2'-O)-methyltransferase
VGENAGMQRSSFPPGLYVAATPIGHLSDISERVRQALTECDLLYAEDTRRAQALLTALGLHRPKSSIRALHGHNEKAALHTALRELGAEKSIVLISDAGTPAISDPGSFLVRAAWESGMRVVALPGPSAVISALSISGFVRWPMSFWGFAPTKAGARRSWLSQILEVRGIAVIFEAPHRAASCLADCAAVFGPETPMLHAREMTKQFETLLRGTIAEVAVQLEALQQQDPGASKGELVWVFDLGDRPPQSQGEAPLKEWAKILCDEMTPARAAKCLMKLAHVSRELAYQAVLDAQKS